MTVPAATFQQFQAIGNREDLEDVIYNISPTDTPFMSMIGRTKATARKHEWQTDALAAVNTSNAAIEGDDATNQTVVPTTRLANYCQIMQKTFGISGTQQAVTSAGRKSEMVYQIAKYGKELKRDMEAILCQNKGSSAGAAASPSTLASLESWIFTNRTDVGSGLATASTPGYISGIVNAPTDNSLAGTMTKSHLDTMIQAAWDAGSEPSVVLVPAILKTRIAGFAGIATLYKEVPGKSQATIIGGADLYVSNFGEHTIVPSRFMRSTAGAVAPKGGTACIIDPEYWAVAYLRPFQTYDLAKTGDAMRKQMLVEATLVARNEASAAKVSTAI